MFNLKVVTLYMKRLSLSREGGYAVPGKSGGKSSYRLLVAMICVGLAVTVLCGMVLSFFSDRPGEVGETGSAGAVIVELIEDEPVDELDEIQFIDHKTFRGKSTGLSDTYIRAYLKPVVEAYDEALAEWILIPVSGDNIVLEITAAEDKWVGADASGNAVNDLSKAKFFYYTEILEKNELTTDLKVQIIDINMPEPFLNMEIRYNLHVFVEGAQVKNSLWKKTFNIESLPDGVEVA